MKIYLAKQNVYDILLYNSNNDTEKISTHKLIG